MNQTELNLYWIQTILYHCFQINSGSSYFDTWASDVGTWTYDENNNLIIDTWLLDNITYNISQPTNETLMTYDTQNVIDFHDQYYLYVNDIVHFNQGAYYFATTAQLNSIPTSRLAICDGFRAYDTTLKRVVYWNNAAQEWQMS